MISMNPAPIVVTILAPLVLWRVYHRVRRLTVRQRSQAWRHWTALLVFPLLTLALGVSALGHPLALGALAGGAAAGIALGLLGLRQTIFERIGSDFFFTPHAGIGVAVALIFIARLLYRAYEFYANGATRQPDFGSSPLTLLAFGILAGYYIVYAYGVLRWRRTHTLAP